MDFYVTRDGQTTPEGPHSIDEIKCRMQDGRLDETWLSWHEGLEGWIPIEELLHQIGGINVSSDSSKTLLNSGSGQIFINHRARSQIMAKRNLYKRLEKEYGKENVFFFQDRVDLGDNYADKIMKGIEDSAVMLAIIGPRWADDIGKTDGIDWVRQELVEAERLGVPIFPLLIDGEDQYPRPQDLPEDLKFMGLRAGRKIRPDEEEFEIDFKRLLDSINKSRERKSTTTPTDLSAWAALGTQGARTRGLYQPDSVKPFRLSRSKLENFLRCPCCFYLDRRLGIAPPFGPAFTINIAVDVLLKKEFDKYREADEAHPLMMGSVPGAIPWPGLLEKEDWRNNFRGIAHLHAPANLLFFGAVDDIWVNEQSELIGVDYKATSKANEINSAEDIGGWYESYKRQMEIYVWLLRQQAECTVSNDIYWVYANGDKTKESFGGSLEFELTIISDQADDSWVEKALIDAHACLQSDAPPDPSPDCNSCKYLGAVANIG